MENLFAPKNYGTNGIECIVKSNFASIGIKNDIIYHYTIEISVRDHVNNENDRKRNQRNKLKQQKKLVNNSNLVIFNKLVNENPFSIFGRIIPAFDSKQNVYSPTELKFDGDRINLEVKVKVPEKKFPKIFDVILIKQDIINLGRLLNEDIKFAERELQALSVIINYGSKNFNCVLNSNIFQKYQDLLNDRNQMEKINFDIGDLKYGRFGHRCAVKLTEKGLKLNVDRVASVFNKGGSLIRIIEEFCTEFRKNNNQNNNSRPSNSRDYSEQYRGGLKGAYSREQSRNSGQQEQRVRVIRNFSLTSHEIRKLNELLKGLDFEVNHLSFKPKFTIFQLTKDSVSQIKFTKIDRENNREKVISVKAHFEETYRDYCSEKLRDNGGQLFGNLPCIQVGSSKNNSKFFPLEVVEIYHDQYYRKKLSLNQQALMAKKCGSQSPKDRFSESERQLKELIKCASNYQNDFLQSFGIEIEKKFNIIKGRILEIPSIIGGNPTPGKGLQPLNAKWKPKDTSGFDAKFDLTNFKWGVFNMYRPGGRPIKKEDVETLIGYLTRSARQNEILLPDPIFKNREVRANIMDNEIRDLITEAKDKHGIKFLLFLIPINFDELYYKIKFISECEVGIVTQCISHIKSRQYRDMSYCENVLLKINSKLGGVNNRLEKQNKVGFLKGKTMIMGLSVNRASREDRYRNSNASREDRNRNFNANRGEKNVNSIASVVATYDSKMVNYHPLCAVQEQDAQILSDLGKDANEIINLKNIVKELFEKFHNRNQFYPEKVVIFRDGLNDGQFEKIMRSEIKSMKDAFMKLNNPNKSICNPKIVYIVCQKKHTVRFLPQEKDALKSGNVRPGFIVDSEITSNFNEFYLCSHPGEMGTSRPTRYIVLYDEYKYTGDEIQQATYNLTFLFPRCSKAVSIVPPILYSQLVAKRARSYLVNLDEDDKIRAANYDQLYDNEKKELNNKIRVREELENKMYFL